MAKPLYRMYRYKRDGSRIILVPVPERGPEATRFCAETYRIANDLFNAGRTGGGGNTVCTSQGGGVIFQYRCPQVNLWRAHLVTQVWRDAKRKGGEVPWRKRRLQ